MARSAVGNRRLVCISGFRFGQRDGCLPFSPDCKGHRLRHQESKRQIVIGEANNNVIDPNSVSPSRQFGLLCVSLLVALLVALPIAWATKGASGLAAAVVANLACLLGGVIALWVCGRFAEPAAVVASVLVGILIRMGLPLAVFIATYFRGGMVVDGGLVFYLLFFYLVMLFVETKLIVAQVTPQNCTGRC